jgi:hypothetical protein
MNPAVRSPRVDLRTAREFAGWVDANSRELAFSGRKSERATETHMPLSLLPSTGLLLNSRSGDCPSCGDRVAGPAKRTPPGEPGPVHCACVLAR